MKYPTKRDAIDDLRGIALTCQEMEHFGLQTRIMAVVTMLEQAVTVLRVEQLAIALMSEAREGYRLADATIAPDMQAWLQQKADRLVEWASDVRALGLHLAAQEEVIERVRQAIKMPHPGTVSGKELAARVRKAMGDE